MFALANSSDNVYHTGWALSMLGWGPCVDCPYSCHRRTVQSSGISTLKGNPVKIVLKDNAQPYSIWTARHVRIQIMPKLKVELILEHLNKKSINCYSHERKYFESAK